MFAVVSTLGHDSNQQITQTSHVPELIESAQVTSLTQQSTNQAEQKPQSASVTDPQPAQPAITTEYDLEAGQETIRELWTGPITGEFGWHLHPVYQDWRYHNGLDISGGEGQIVPALLSGEVVEITTDKHYGLTVAVKSGKYTVYYGSLASVAVHKNNLIETGKPIGSMGISISEPEPHLHLAVRINDGNQVIDPRDVFKNIHD
jgi:murein DD-endopeptidase MepM/ murein hydrolase activator NlpD